MQKSRAQGMKGSKRKYDYAAEEIVSEFLDTYFYPIYEEVSSFTRLCGYGENGKAEQHQGVDVYLSIPEKKILQAKVDEKAAVHYINKNLKTFAFELSAKQRGGRRVEGWFPKKNLTTTHYGLIWIKGTEDKLSDITQITEVEYMLIPRQELQVSINFDLLLEDKNALTNVSKVSDYMLAEETACDRYYPYENSKYYFVKSKYLVEMPVNLVVQKEYLSQMSKLHVLVSPKGVFEL